MPKLSVIVPVYNVETYIKKCLESILNQTFKDFEVIIIDDGSTDKSGTICDEYAINDNRVMVIHQNNQGVSVARNNGIVLAKGDYIGFVDADDWIEPTMYEKLLSYANCGNYDVIICGLNYYSDDRTFIRSVHHSNILWKNTELIDDLYATPSKVTGACCNKIFYRYKIKNVRFDNKIHMAEDIVYLINCFDKIETGYQIDECLYNVLERNSSSTRKDKIDAMYRIVIEGKKAMMNYALAYSDDLGKKAAVKYLDDCLRYSNLIMKTGKKEKVSYLGKYILLRMEALKSVVQFYVSGKIDRKTLKRFFIESVL